MEKPIFNIKENAIKEKKCFDCNKKIEIIKDNIKDGALLIYEENGEDIFVLKCDKCLEKSKELINYKKCEVYSRIVGYLRPVNQWNAGKRREYEERKEYKVTE